RPMKWRKVCCLPESNKFGPLDSPTDSINNVNMTVDEYETIRLIDLAGFTQEECAEKMSIARTTVQRIYNDARKKLADSLVNGKTLVIKGGDYKLCDGREEACNCGGCYKHRYGRVFDHKG
ncbi:MAG TPA: hypothetical protein DEA44_07200, partial [Firmicutes bacterium]|nr:hypothetical protein [Bacillota bacterium]